MGKNTYLSVDLDYWYRPGMRNSIDFIKELMGLNRPVTVFTEHHLVLKEIKKPYKRVYNIDYHSDITEPAPGWPECGNWVNHVPGRGQGKFMWCLPNWKECVTNGNGFCHRIRQESSIYNPFIDDTMHSWRSVNRQVGIRNLPLDDVDRISLVLSPEWSFGEYISDTLCYLIAAQEDGKVDFYGRRVKPLIKEMLRRGGPFYNWY